MRNCVSALPFAPESFLGSLLRPITPATRWLSHSPSFKSSSASVRTAMKSLLSAPEVNIPSSRGRASRIQTIKWHCRRQRSGGAKNKGTFQEKGADSVVYVPGNRGQEIGDERNLFTAQHLWFDEGGPISSARGRTPFCVDGYADGAAKRGPHLPRMSMIQKRRSSWRLTGWDIGHSTKLATLRLETVRSGARLGTSWCASPPVLRCSPWSVAIRKSSFDDGKGVTAISNSGQLRLERL
jgi:hypothetical protein